MMIIDVNVSNFKILIIRFIIHIDRLLIPPSMDIETFSLILMGIIFLIICYNIIANFF